ncbi:MAG TPA: DUF6748 domain-containing protein [Pyrinomonadaceae bacterium]|nr:DUF6748 domain-containing protein [Pyrinomonadaceae bacterium]
MILRFSLLAAILASLTFAPAATNKPLASLNVPESTPDSLSSTSSFYSFRRDLRRCASPRCGGYFVKLVNKSRTRCADGRNQSECYVAEIDWRGQAEPDSDRGLLRGTIRRKGQFGEFRVTEVWQAASANQPADKFFRVRDRGLRCIAAPCPTHHEATLNSTASRNIAGVDLSGAGAPESVVSDANQAMTSPDGILVSGNHSPVTGPAGRMQMLKASQFYVRAGNSGSGSSSGSGDVSLKPCKKTGCSSQVCSDEDVMTTCEWSPVYECYKKATCERQKNGQCGFTQTPELLRCMSRAKGQ